MAKNSTILPIALGLGAAFLIFGGKSANAQNNPYIPTSPETLPEKLTPTDFVKKYYPSALNSQQRTQVPATVTLAQAAVESLWGKAAYGNNFFGIKADSNWKGDIQFLKEWGCGKTGDPVLDGIHDQIIAIYPPGDPNGHPGCKNLYSYRVNAKFRKYPTPADSFSDHGYFLKYNNRYSKAFNFTDDPKQFVIEIAKAGYASAPDYATSINSMIDSINQILA